MFGPPLFTITGESIALGRPAKLVLLGTRPETHPLCEKLQSDLFPSIDGRTQYVAIQGLNPRSSSTHDRFEKAEALVFMVSTGTSRDPWFHREFPRFYSAHAQRDHVPIIPVRLDDVPLPPAMATIPTIDLFADYHAGFRALILLLGSKGEDLLAALPEPDTAVLRIAERVSHDLVLRFREHPDELRSIDRRLFEEMIAYLFRRFGYVVELTQRTRDGGRDVIAVRTQIVSVKYLIECKRPDPGGYVGVRPVRELYGVLKDEGATKGLLVTTARFSPDALSFFERHRWELEPKDFAGLMNWIDQYRRLADSLGKAGQ